MSTATAGIDAKRKEHAALLAELETYQSKDNLTDAEAVLANKKASVALDLQKEIDEWDTRESILAKGRELGKNLPLPRGKVEEDEEKTQDVAGYMTPGDYFVASREFKSFQGGAVRETNPVSMPKVVRTKGDTKYLVPITKAERHAFQSKASDLTLNAGVIEPLRLPEIVRATEFDQLTLLGLVNTSPTSSPSITYRRVTSFTRAAAPVAPSSEKPDAAATVSLVTWNVFTHAVTLAVTEQQLADAAQVVNEINTHLLYDLDKLKEEQMTYGSGAGQNHMGFFNDPNIAVARSEAGDTLLDRIRRAITDIRRNGYSPNAVYMDPLDWEQIELLKVGAADDRYIWAVIRDVLGARVWSLRVVEGKSAEDTATGERNVLVGDFNRGATRWVREAVALAMGWVNDQFLINERTIRAEGRDAFGITRPGAFVKIQTEGPSS
jgi:HK97 family phage major capsid protein